MKRTRRTLTCLFGLLLGTLPAALAQPGTLDPSFNSNGYVVQPVNTLDVVQKILVQDDGRILTIGMSWDASYVARAYVFRYLPDGTPDADFATNGVFSYEMDFEALLYSGIITDEGKILLVGATTDYQTYRMLLIQLNADGTPDDGFGTNGVATQSVSLVGPNAEDMLYDVTQDADGNILVCGSSYDLNYVRRPVVVRFTASGALDTAFGVDGVATIPVMNVGASAFKCVHVQPDGRIVASGFFGETELWYTLLLVRFNADGSLDDSFSDDGIVRHSYGNVDDEAEDFQFTADGSIVVAGKTVTADYDYSALLMKFTADGEVDGSFGNAGAVVEDLAAFDYAWNLALEPDGRIVMAGTSGIGPPNGFDLAVWKYLPDGTRDAAFGTNGLAQPVIPDYYAMIYGLALQADGRILIGGQARTPINENFFFIARLQNEIISGAPDAQVPARALISPNPATAGAWVMWSDAAPLRANAALGLYAASGHLVATFRAHQLEQRGNGIGLRLPADLAPGIYHLRLQHEGAIEGASIIIH